MSSMSARPRSSLDDPATPMPAPSTARAERAIALTLITWLVLAVTVGLAGGFDRSGPPLLLGVFAGLPVAGFVMAYRLNAGLRALALRVPLWLVTAAHVMRGPTGLIFLIGVLRGTLPPAFGLPAGVGDLVAGIASVPLAVELYRRGSRSSLHRRYVAWNAFGLTDLLQAMVMGLLYSVSTIGVLSSSGSSSRAILVFPLSLIPTFYVPLLIVLHLLGFRRHRETR
jgi:hypothetical protein